MTKIADLLRELERNDVNQPYYNGVEVRESENAYQKKLNSLYEDVMDELLSTTVDKDLIVKRLRDVSDNQSYFFYPTREDIQCRRDEEIHNNSESLKQETDYMEFVMKCVELQRYYMGKLGVYFNGTNPQEECDIKVEKLKTIETDNPKDLNDKIKGVKGLAEFLGCGANKAQEILNSCILQENGIAYRAGKCWRFKKDELCEFVRKNPNAFR